MMRDVVVRFAAQVFIVSTSIIIITISEYFLFILIDTKTDIDYYSAIFIIFIVFFLMTQTAFATLISRRFLDVIDYSCFLMGTLGILGIIGTFSTFYDYTREAFRSSMELQIQQAKSVLPKIDLIYCRDQGDITLGEYMVKCELFKNLRDSLMSSSFSIFDQNKPTSLCKLYDRNIEKIEANKQLVTDKDHAGDLAFALESIDGFCRKSKELDRFNPKELGELVKDEYARLFTLVLTQNVILYKLGLVLLKRRPEAT